MQAEVKREILLMVHRAKEKGVKLTRSCEILQLPLQRYCAWSRRDREEKLDGVSDPLLDGKPGPAPDEAPHGLLREETYADLPPHQLAVVASEKGGSAGLGLQLLPTGQERTSGTQETGEDAGQAEQAPGQT